MTGTPIAPHGPVALPSRVGRRVRIGREATPYDVDYYAKMITENGAPTVVEGRILGTVRTTSVQLRGRRGWLDERHPNDPSVPLEVVYSVLLDGVTTPQLLGSGWLELVATPPASSREDGG